MIISVREDLVIFVDGEEIVIERRDSDPRQPVQIRLRALPGGIEAIAVGPHRGVQGTEPVKMTVRGNSDL